MTTPIHLEPGGTPIDELDGPLGLNGGDGSIDVLGDDISTVEETTCHILSVTRIAFHLKSYDNWSYYERGEGRKESGDRKRE